MMSFKIFTPDEVLLRCSNQGRWDERGK